MAARPLDGVRVLDLGQVYAGPFAARALADLGAEVIRVEWARRPGRATGPGAVYPQDEPGERPYNRSAYYNELNRGKRAISLDLSHERGRALFLRLVALSDVLIENFSPRVMGNLGLDYPVLREAHPALIMVSISAYGASGPWRDYGAYGPGLEAASGFSALMGYPGGPPLRLGVAYADPTAGLHAAFAALAALRRRRRTGQGAHIDLAMRESLTQMLGESLVGHSLGVGQPARHGNAHPFAAPHGVYPCKGEDAWVALAVTNDGEWQGLCRALGFPSWTQGEHFQDASRRWRHRAELDRHLADWTAGLTPEEAAGRLQAEGVSAAAVSSPVDVLADPQLAAQGFFLSIRHPEAGDHLHPGVPWRLREGPEPRPAPLFAQDNGYVFQGLLGLTGEEIAALEAEGVVARAPQG